MDLIISTFVSLFIALFLIFSILVFQFNSFRQPGVDYPELVVTAPAGNNLVIDYSSNGWSEYHGPG
ncbi:MAG: hypothetical protein ACPHY8_04170, partial [Patescibacteria group bacterium]